jgi:uncharacterized protein
MDYTIDIKKLPNGKHFKEFKIDTEFFNSYGNDIIKHSDLVANVQIEKSAGWIKVDCNIVGIVVVECDRCLADLEIPLNVNFPFTVKFTSYSEEPEWQDNVVVLNNADTELDMSQVIYDYVCVNLPMQKVHREGECDVDMLKKLNEILK